jgi:hypothetical protein
MLLMSSHCIYSAWLRAGRPRFNSRQVLRIFLFATASRPALGPTQPSIQWVAGDISPGVKRPGREADHSSLSSAKVKNAWSYTSTSPYAFMAWCLVKHRDNVRYVTLRYVTLRYITLHYITIVGWTIGILAFDSQWGLEIFLFTTASRTALGSIQPPMQWVPGALSMGVKRPEREADHSPPSSAEVKNTWSYTSTPQYVFMAWCLVKHRDNFTFTFTLLL